MDLLEERSRSKGLDESRLPFFDAAEGLLRTG